MLGKRMKELCPERCDIPSIHRQPLWLSKKHFNSDQRESTKAKFVSHVYSSSHPQHHKYHFESAFRSMLPPLNGSSHDEVYLDNDESVAFIEGSILSEVVEVDITSIQRPPIL